MWGILLALAVAAEGDAARLDLPRRPFLGASLGAISEDLRARLGMENARGAWVRAVVPDSPADGAGLRTDDVVVEIGRRPVASPGEAIAALKSFRVGDGVEVVVRRGPERLAKQLTLDRPLPVEASNRFDVAYLAIHSGEARLRGIVTRPRTPGKHPAILYVQEAGCRSIDEFAVESARKQLLYRLTEKGHVTLRVELSGVGDSDGGTPCEQLSLGAEAGDFAAALRALQALDYVDARRIVLVGHGLGATVAALVTAEVPAAGIVAFGACARPWLECAVERVRREGVVAGRPPGDTEARARATARFWAAVLFEGKTAEEALGATGQPRTRLDAEDVELAGRSAGFWRELSDLPLARSWDASGVPLLALWGEADYVASADDARFLLSAVNASRAGTATLRPLPSVDHAFGQASSMRDSARQGMSAPLNPVVADAIDEWARRLAPPPRK
jgi:pimeloyl-ACP methyl ester carboxylesterase